MALKNKVKTGVADGILAPTSTFLEVTIRAGGKVTKGIVIIIIATGLATGLEGASNDRSKSRSCPYPADPINWVLGYCGYVVGTDDEITIQESKCFKNADADLKSKDECSINKKYKTKTCEFIIKQKYADYKSVDACLKDKKVKPFFAGE